MFADIVTASGFLNNHGGSFRTGRRALRDKGVGFFAEQKAKADTFDEIIDFIKDDKTAAVDIEGVKREVLRVLKIEKDGVQKAKADAFDKLVDSTEELNDKDKDLTAVQHVKHTFERVKGVLVSKQDSSTQNLPKIVWATIRFFSSRQALWTQMARRLGQARDHLLKAHYYVPREDVKVELEADMKHMDEQVALLPIHDSREDFRALFDENRDTTGDLFALSEHTCVDGIDLEEASELVLERHGHVRKMRDILDGREIAEQEKIELGNRVVEIFIKHLARDPEWVPEASNIEWSV